jgi:hypothetical protein
MSRYLLLKLAVFAVGLTFLAAGCGKQGVATHGIDMPEVAVRTPADSLALLAYNAAGGSQMWGGDHIPYLQFAFGTGEPETRRKHLWNRMTGQYRLERRIGSDTTLVVLFNVDTKQGKAYYNESPVPDSLNARIVEGAHRTFINDTYWLLMPTKLFDEGVQRSLVPDSSTSETGVLRLTFQGVGYTPDDNYWIWIDRATGHVMQWTYMLQGRSTMSTTRWVDYEPFEMDGMTAQLATRKESPDGSFVMFTSPISMPKEVDAALFTSPSGKLL